MRCIKGRKRLNMREQKQEIKKQKKNKQKKSKQKLTEQEINKQELTEQEITKQDINIQKIKDQETKETEIKEEKIKEEKSEITKLQIEENNIAEENVKIKKYKKKGRLKKAILALVFNIVLASIVIYYCNIANYYQTHFFPHTYINGFDCSNVDVETVAIWLESQAREYSIELIGRNQKGSRESFGVLEAKEFGLTLIDAEGAISEILEQQNELLWITTLKEKRRSYNLVQGTTFDKEMLKETLYRIKGLQKENMLSPTDAYISEYSEEKHSYEIIPETKGNLVDMEMVVDAVHNAILKKDEAVDLEELGCYLSAEITSDHEKLQKSVKTVNQWLQTDITYDWNGNKVHLATDEIEEWISWTKGEFPEPRLDEDAVAEFVENQAKEYDTYGKNRKFVTSLGVELSLPSGAYGWKTDCENEAKELTELIYQGSVENREPVYLKKAAAKGSNDIGSSYVEADLTYQHLYLYQNGVLMLETDFVSGDMNVAGNITPPGVFGLTYKTTNAVLRGADYETPVNYWMPFHGNFGMHDATWRSEFGGTIYLTNGSHGCINLPLDKAAAIYHYVSTGFPVICYYY